MASLSIVAKLPTSDPGTLYRDLFGLAAAMDEVRVFAG